MRNPTGPTTYQLTFPANTTVTMTVGTQNLTPAPGTTASAVLTVQDYTGVQQTGTSVTALAVNGSAWNVQINIANNNPGGGTGGGNQNNPPANWIADPYVAPAVPPATGAFGLVAPQGGAMVTNTRRPALSWNASPGAVQYDVYLNLSRTDYKWDQPGSFLDRYTHMGSVTTNNYTPTLDLSDRWTYKWYVVATDGRGVKTQSDVGIFSVYLPTLTTVNDGVAVINGCRDLNGDGIIEPYEDWHNPVSVRVADLLSRMTPEQKALQLFFNRETLTYPDAGFGFGPYATSDMLKFQLGEVQHQSGAGLTLVPGNKLGIPMIALGDTIHGYQTSYPTQPGLAAMHDPQTVWAVADVQRRESCAVGLRGTLSPLAEIGTKALYPRIQEGNGEDAELASADVRAMVVGLQGGPELNPHSMMITLKHWAGQGAGGETGVVFDGTTVWYHMRPWHAAIEAGVSAIMPGYSGSWLLGTTGEGAGSDPGILSFLRNAMGFKGIVMTDWLPYGSWEQACTAGSDVMGGAYPGQPDGNTPPAYTRFTQNVDVSRINDSVAKVLDAKFRMGLFEDPYQSGVAGQSEWHTGENVAIVHKAAEESLTLLKNDGVLPFRLPAGGSIVVDGVYADKVSPSPMVTWGSGFHHDDFGSKTIYESVVSRAQQDGVKVYGPSARTPVPIPSGVTPSAAIVVVGEGYYTHGVFWYVPGGRLLPNGGALDSPPWLPDDPIGGQTYTPVNGESPQYALIQKYRGMGIPTVVVSFLPRPYLFANVNALANALMMVYRPGDEGGPAVAEALFGDRPPTGRLPWQLPLSLDQVGGTDAALWQSQPDHWDLPYDMGATASEVTAIRSAIAAGQHLEPIYGKPLYQYGAGIQGYGLTDGTPPAAFGLLTPMQGQAIADTMPAFSWQASSDPDTGIQRYEVYLDGVKIGATRSATSYKMMAGSFPPGMHSWYVVAYNWAGGSTASPTFSFSLTDSQPPGAFEALAPAGNATAAGTDPVTFYWSQAVDGGTGVASYQLRVDGATVATVPPSSYLPPTLNLAFGATATATSTASGTPGNAVDADATNTRWQAAWDSSVANPDKESLTLDLGDIYLIRQTVIKWENTAAYGKKYQIMVSTDGKTWTSAWAQNNGQGGTDASPVLDAPARWVRMQGVQRGTVYGYSIFDFQVYGVGAERTTVPLSPGTHSWNMQAVDGAGNATLNSNGSQTLVR